VRGRLPRAWLAVLVATIPDWRGLAASPASAGDLPPVAAAASAQRSPESDDEVVCRVNGAPIRRGEVNAEEQKLVSDYSFHGDVDEEKLQALRRRSLQNLIDAELKYREAEKRGVKVSDAEVERALDALIARYPDRDAFEDRLRGSGIQLEEVEASLRRERMIVKAERQVARTDAEIGEAEVRRYYDENRADFEQPRAAVVRRIFVLVPPLGRNPEVWQAAFETAAAARARIEAGESFEALVNEVSDVSAAEKANGGLLGTVSAGRLEPTLDAALWSTPEGGGSPPIRTFKGIYLLKVDRFLPTRPVAFEEVRKKLRANLQNELSRQRVKVWLAGLRAEAEIEILDPSLASPPQDRTDSAEDSEPHP
jgi:peptidyl-prolyl cis-trans isomerase C